MAQITNYHVEMTNQLLGKHRREQPAPIDFEEQNKVEKRKQEPAWPKLQITMCK